MSGFSCKSDEAARVAVKREMWVTPPLNFLDLKVRTIELLAYNDPYVNLFIESTLNLACVAVSPSLFYTEIFYNCI